MANLLGPSESLESYFDELFAMDDEDSSEPIASEERNPPLSQKPSVTTAKASAISEKLSAPFTKTQAAIKPIEPLAAYAEPDHEQREKLQKLLQSAPPKVQTETKVQTEKKVQTETKLKTEIQLKTETKLKTESEVQQETKPIPVVVKPNETRPITAPSAVQPKIAAPIADVQTQEQIHLAMDAKAAEWLPNGRPSWAQSRFDVLLFQVSGLTLAVPLASLGQIQKITEELTPLFGQADWFMGLLPTPAGKIRTVNTAKFVMPERYDENFPKNAKLVVSINGVPWGLAVDSVNQPISIDPEQVKWRGDRSKRPWLAGTVKDHMCALLDIPTIGLILQSADKNAYKSYG